MLQKPCLLMCIALKHKPDILLLTIGKLIFLIHQRERVLEGKCVWSISIFEGLQCPLVNYLDSLRFTSDDWKHQ